MRVCAFQVVILAFWASTWESMAGTWEAELRTLVLEYGAAHGTVPPPAFNSAQTNRISLSMP
jgi:hypothetical protein